MKPLAKEAIAAVKDGRIEFIPERFSKIYLNWMENVQDWCISRQLWWGHQIPAWYCSDCGAIIVSRQDPTECTKCGSKNLTRDEDVLDTWFSSALWPFSTLGWPEKTAELEYFYPTSVLVTAYDIIFFWVARMIFSGLEHMKKEPFKKVFIHGIIRDAQGRKMSKSLGNGIDPIDVIEKYGADALRVTLVTGVSPGNDTRFTTERVEANRNFVNKLWNASRFVLMHLEDEYYPLPKSPNREDKWILTLLNTLIAEVTENIERYELGVAAQKLYDFVWDSFCDWYIEFSKPRLSEGGEAAASAKGILLHVLNTVLKLLHPFIPFVTEQIYGVLPGNDGLLITSKWPCFDKTMVFEKESSETERLMGAIRAIRNRRAETNVPPSKKTSITILTSAREIYSSSESIFKKLASVSDIFFAGDMSEINENKMTGIVSGADQLFIPTDELVDVEKELERLEKEREKVVKELEKLNAKLSNQGFLSKAPAEIVEAEKARAAVLTDSAAALESAISALKNR